MTSETPDLDRRLRSLANYCRHLSRELIDPGMKQTFQDAAKHFDEAAVAFRSARASWLCSAAITAAPWASAAFRRF